MSATNFGCLGQPERPNFERCNKPCSFTRQRGYTHGIGQNGANAMTKPLTFHSSVLSPELSDMSDRLISDQETYIAHLLYIAQELKKNKITITTIAET